MSANDMQLGLAHKTIVLHVLSPSAYLRQTHMVTLETTYKIF